MSTTGLVSARPSLRSTLAATAQAPRVVVAPPTFEHRCALERPPSPFESRILYLDRTIEFWPEAIPVLRAREGDVRTILILEEGHELAHGTSCDHIWPNPKLRSQHRNPAPITEGV